MTEPTTYAEQWRDLNRKHNKEMELHLAYMSSRVRVLGALMCVSMFCQIITYAAPAYADLAVLAAWVVAILTTFLGMAGVYKTRRLRKTHQREETELIDNQ